MATLAATRSLPRFVYRRLTASNCLITEDRRLVTQSFTRATAEADVGKGYTMRIYGPSPPKKIPSYNRKQKFLKGYDPSLTFVSETKYTSPLFDGLQRDLSPKPDIFILHEDDNGCQYFAAHSVESDGTIVSSPKYHIYPPEKGLFFASSSCNGLLHFQNVEYDNVVWNPTTGEFKMFAKRFGPPLPRVSNDYLDYVSWCDPSYEDCKVLQVVMANKEDEEGEYDGSSYHMELYSLKTNSYKKIECMEFSWVALRGGCINGVYYCPADRVGGDVEVLLSFDFSTETLSSLPVPPHMSGSDYLHYVEYKGLFGFILGYVPKTGPWEFVFWVLENGSWRKESVFHCYGVYKPLWFSENGELLYFSTFDDELVVFDRCTGNFKHLGVYSNSCAIKPVPVSKSFVRLDEISDAGVHIINKVEKEEEKEVDVNKQEDMVGAEYGPLVLA